jgi:L-alanine-DL-glutamate epimerase-like enolase superfamily enzyme
MRITSVEATPLNVPVRLPGAERPSTTLSVCLVAVRCDDGRTGHGMTAITEEEVVAAAIEHVVAPALIGEDPLATERLWERLYWLLAPRGQTGYACHAIAAIDLALWDLRAQAAGEPLWRLLGGARPKVPIYATFGYGFMDREHLAEAAKAAAAQGFPRLKMTVGGHALARRDEPRPLRDVIAEDTRRVAAVRDAVGAGVEIAVDANCGLDALHAGALAHAIEPMGIAFFEEPLTQNDASQLRALRRRTRIPLAAGQNEGLAWRFRDLLQAEAVDILQPNVCIGGGFTTCLKVAGLAHAFNVPIDNGGAWPFHNMHLHAGVMNGGMVEFHHLAVDLLRQVFDGTPEPQAGWLALPTRPGLGFEPAPERVRELARRPLSRGRGKA